MRTKNLFTTAVLLMALMTLGLQYGCSSSNATTSSADTSNSVTPSDDLGFNSLLDMLRRQPNLFISGNGPNATVSMRGSRSIEGTSEPLFVVDGTPLGYGYNSASTIDVTTVESIRVLSPAQSGLYGSRGGNGVIQIRLKK